MKLVHLSPGPGARREQIRELAALAGGGRGPPDSRDFNTFGGVHEIGSLPEAGLVKADARGGGLFQRPADARPDLILHSPEITVSGVKVPKVRFSDYLPVVCDFCLSLKPWGW